MVDIIELLHNGNWSDAIEKYKALNISANEFMEYLYTRDKDSIADIALLGFYARGEN